MVGRDSGQTLSQEPKKDSFEGGIVNSIGCYLGWRVERGYEPGIKQPVLPVGDRAQTEVPEEQISTTQ